MVLQPHKQVNCPHDQRILQSSRRPWQPPVPIRSLAVLLSQPRYRNCALGRNVMAVIQHRTDRRASLDRRRPGNLCRYFRCRGCFCADDPATARLSGYLCEPLHRNHLPCGRSPPLSRHRTAAKPEHHRSGLGRRQVWHPAHRAQPADAAAAVFRAGLFSHRLGRQRLPARARISRNGWVSPHVPGRIAGFPAGKARVGLHRRIGSGADRHHPDHQSAATVVRHVHDIARFRAFAAAR